MNILYKFNGWHPSLINNIYTTQSDVCSFGVDYGKFLRLANIRMRI